MCDFFDKDNFLERLEMLRNKYGLSKGEFSKKVGVSNIFSRYATPKPGQKERKIKAPSVETLLAISREFNASVDWLLTGEEKITQTTTPQETDDSVHELIEEVGGLPSKEYWEFFYQVTSDPTWEGWYKIELIRRFPEIAERIKKRMDVGDEAALERPQAVGEK